MKLIEHESPVTDLEVAAHIRTYNLLQMGIQPGAAEDVPAVTLDWLLEIHKAMRKRYERKMNGG